MSNKTIKYRKADLNNKSYRNKKSYLVLMLALFISTFVSAGSNEMETMYSINLLGTKIGKFSIVQKSENGNVNIEAITDVEVKLLFTYRIKYIQNTVYEQGVLKSSNVKTYKNGKLNSDTMLKLENDVYLRIVDGDTAVVNYPITYSGSLLYFNEPVGVKQLYKERTAEMRPITLLSDHTYVVTDENKRELNRYIYKDGILEYAKMQHPIGAMELERVIENSHND
ncbi:MAG: DUF6134 family protein [Draconibacterium sp.]